MKSLLCTLLLSVSLSGCQGRPRTGVFADAKPNADGTGQVIEIDLTDPLPESTDGGAIVRLSADRTLAGLLRRLERARNDADVRGVYVRFGDETLSWTRAEELGSEFQEFAKSGKPVVCHAHALSNASSWLTLHGCSRIWLSSAGNVDTVGIAAQVVYMKGLLDRLKISPDFLSVGKYKSFAESMTREGPSDAAREALAATLGSIRQTWLDDAKVARPRDDLASSLEGGPWSAEEAKQRGLIDAIGFESEARDDAKSQAKAGRIEKTFGPGAGGERSNGIAEIIRLVSGATERQGDTPHVAVVPAIGGISMSSGGGLGGNDGITFTALARTLRRLRDDDATKAVVLRIDSPGGSALASDLLWHELMQLRARKPLIVSIGDMAASGGYYLASAADRILAPKTSIVGSIGVVGGKIVFGDALRELGVNAVTIPANPAEGAQNRAAYLSALTPWDEATRERVQAQMNAVYDLFISRVAEGRHMDAAQVKASAEGRIWSGAQGLERGLVDEIGGLTQALRVARARASLADDAPVVLEGTRETLLESLLLGDQAEAAEVSAAVGRWQAARALLLDQLPQEWLAFADSVRPWSQGEIVLATAPFVFRIE